MNAIRDHRDRRQPIVDRLLSNAGSFADLLGAVSDLPEFRDALHAAIDPIRQGRFDVIALAAIRIQVAKLARLLEGEAEQVADQEMRAERQDAAEYAADVACAWQQERRAERGKHNGAR